MIHGLLVLSKHGELPSGKGKSRDGQGAHLEGGGKKEASPNAVEAVWFFFLNLYFLLLAVLSQGIHAFQVVICLGTKQDPVNFHDGHPRRIQGELNVGKISFQSHSSEN